MTEPTAADGPSLAAAGPRPSLEELARAKGMKPIESAEDLQSYAVPLFESDEEVEEFLGPRPRRTQRQELKAVSHSH